jgi:hypothetical protein
MDQGELTGIYCTRPQNFAWFLGAGSSRTAGLPTAADIIWDLKCRYYCREENQEISRQDVQTEAVRARIQAFLDSRGFPARWDDNEYTTYFEKIFTDDYELHRQYLKGILSEDNVTLSVGSRVLGALLASGHARAVFTTNFDSVIEKAVAEVSGQSLSAYHLEGAHNAVSALNNDEFPLYCKLHGDFRYDSLKNLKDDLKEQHQSLSQCLVNAANRFGFVVTGYSGRDASVMALFDAALESNNPFPHGLYWTGIKGSDVHPAVEVLLEKARAHDVEAEYVEIQTFDAFLLRLWRNLATKTAELDAKVRRTDVAKASIQLPKAGTGKPLVRMNALPILTMPTQCQQLSFVHPKEWRDLHEARNNTKGALILTKSEAVFGWGHEQLLRDTFGAELSDVSPRTLPAELDAPDNLNVKGLVEEALSAALARSKPLLIRTPRAASFLICDPDANDKALLKPLTDVVGAVSGNVPSLFTQVTEEHPRAQQVRWSEALRVHLEIKDGRHWLTVDPDIWIWPQRSRRDAAAFMDKRRGDRFNKKYNELLEAWIHVVLGTDKRNTSLTFSAFEEGSDAENPVFEIGTRSAYTKRLTS